MKNVLGDGDIDDLNSMIQESDEVTREKLLNAESVEVRRAAQRLLSRLDYLKNRLEFATAKSKIRHEMGEIRGKLYNLAKYNFKK